MWRPPSLARVALLLLVGSLLAGTAPAQGPRGGQDSARGGHIAGETLLPLKSASLQPPYLDSPFMNRWWDFGGNTVVEVNKQVRLTQDMPSQSGWLFARTPLTSTAWQIEFDFRVHGKGSNLYGDGFAFWYVAEKGQGPVFGSKDLFTGLGIFFDTYANDERRRATFPYVMAMIGDGKTPYDKEKDGRAAELAGCMSDFRNREHRTRARIRYSRDRQTLTVELAVKQVDVFTECFRKEGVTLPMVGFMGFSAHTGGVSDNHDILNVESYGILDNNPKPPVPALQDSKLPTRGPTAPVARTPGGARPRSTSGNGTWWKVIAALVLVGGAGFAALRYFQVIRGKSAKSF